MYKLERTQVLPVPLTIAWKFFSDPLNLGKITDKELELVVLSKHDGESIYAGQIIEYTVKPLPLLTFNWVTEITHVDDHKYFVDEQRRGPYAFWHHQHHFENKGPSVIMRDIVHYRIPFGIAGRIAHSLFVKKKLERIFDYRSEVIRDIFTGQD